MTSLQIRTLLAPLDVKEAHHNTIIYVNSRFNAFDDLDSLEDVVAEAQLRDEELRSKLAISQTSVDKLVSETREAALAHSSTAQELSLQRHSLADELTYLFSQLTSALSEQDAGPTLLEDIETLHRNLKELESVKSYVQVIQHALKLSEAACEQVRSFPVAAPLSQSSVTEYQALQRFVSKVAAVVADVEDGTGKQTLNLVTFLEKIRDKCWADIKSALSSTLLAASENLGWPMPVDYAAASAEVRRSFEKAFTDLLRLQSFGEKLRPQTNPKEESGLYSLQALVQPISMRFKYHFEGTRQTNRIDKPEWYFTHVQNIIHEHQPFMEAVIQPLLATTDYRAIVAWKEFTLLLFPLLSRKLRRSMPSLLPHPPLLAHTIYQSLLFDAAVQEQHFTLAGSSAGKSDDGNKWDGISDVILGQEEWFAAWMNGEKHYLRSTTSARRLKALVEQVTDRYSPLPQFAHRTRFLINVQIPLLENYYGRILASLDAFETLSSALGGRDEGSVKVDAGRLTAGVEGVQRLCKAWLSAHYIEAAMEGWGEELFFLELWTEISRRAALRAQAKVVASLPDPGSASATAPQETVFEELVTLGAEEMIVQQVCGEIESGLKLHFSATTSPSLGPISLLSTHLTYLRTTLPQNTMTAIYRRIASRLAEHILQRQILYRGQISRQDGKSIHAECELWVETCQTGLGGALGGGRVRVERPWLRLLQAGRLLGLEGDSWNTARDGTFGARGADEWEELMLDLCGASELTREEVHRIIKNVNQ
ncbi:RINT-1 family protein [Mycena amicta]|nr:RINT-1 family protein [Mycena amicta]